MYVKEGSRKDAKRAKKTDLRFLCAFAPLREILGRGRDGVNEFFERLEVSQVEHFNRRVTVPPGPRQSDMQHSITHKIRAVSPAIGGPHLKRNILPAREARSRGGRQPQPDQPPGSASRRSRAHSSLNAHMCTFLATLTGAFSARAGRIQESGRGSSPLFVQRLSCVSRHFDIGNQI